MGTKVEALLRNELSELDARREIIEDALARLAALNGIPPEETAEQRTPTEQEHVWHHPTLGRIAISRDHPRWERSWRHEVARIKDAIREIPGATPHRIADAAKLSGGHTSGILRFLEAEGEIEADQEELRMQAHRRGKTYHLVADEPEVTQSEPEPEPKVKPKKAKAKRKGKVKRRKQGVAARLVFDAIVQNPGANAKQITGWTGVSSKQVRNEALKLVRVGRLVRHQATPTSEVTWTPAEQDPVRPQPPDGPQREVKITPGEGVDLGRLKRTPIGGGGDE